MSEVVFLSRVLAHHPACLARGVSGSLSIVEPLLAECAVDVAGDVHSRPVTATELLKQVAVTAVLVWMICGWMWVVRRLWLRQAQSVVPAARKAYDLTVVLDLDETLVSFGDDAYVEEGEHGVRHRPHLRDFLGFLKEEDVEVILWTAATPGYSKAVLDSLHGIVPGVVHHRVSRCPSWYDEEDHVKDLRRLGRPLSRVLMVENRAASGRLQPANTVLVPDFVQDRRQAVPESGGDAALLHVRDIIRTLLASGRSVSQVLSETRATSQVTADKIDEGPASLVFHYVCDKFADWFDDVDSSSSCGCTSSDEDQ